MNSPGKIALALLAVFVFGLSGRDIQAQLPSLAPHDLLPEQKIEVNGAEMLPWKAAWDKARKSALQGDFKASLQYYETLLKLKNNLEEGRWELARLLMHLERWEEAAVHLELLVEGAPGNWSYVSALGRVMWEMGRFERAVNLFEKVHAADPSDRIALAGLVEALVKQERKSEAVPYLEKLVNQEPTNRGTRRYLAFLLHEAGKYEKAVAHLIVLARNENAESDILHKTASALEQIGRTQQAAAYWERILVREPENMEAHMFLADHYEKAGQADRMLLHLKKAVAASPADRTASVRLGKAYETRGEYGKALTSYRDYLLHFPADDAVIHLADNVVSLLGQQEKTPPLSPVDVVTDRQEQAAKLLGNIGRLRDAGRLEEAVELYRQLIETAPDHDAALPTLANDLVLLAEKKGRGAMLRFLADIVATDTRLYRSVAEELLHLDRKDELLSVLEEIHRIDPGDTFANQELAVLSFKRGEWQKSLEYFTGLVESGCRNSSCLEERARLAEDLDLKAQALRAYESLLQRKPGRLDIRVKATDLAARLGFLDRAVFHGGYLQLLQEENENLVAQLLLADAFRDSGYLTRAETRYRSIIAEAAEKNDASMAALHSRSWLALAAAYEKAGLPYEAEEALRTALVQGVNRTAVLEALFYLYLRSGRVAESEIWLQALALEFATSGESGTRKDIAWMEEFLQAEMYDAAGDHELAGELYWEAEKLLLDGQGGMGRPHDSAPVEVLLRIRIKLAASLLHEGRYWEAERTVRDLQKGWKGKLELLVLLEEIYRAWGTQARAEKIAAEAQSYARHDPGRQLRLAALYRKYGNSAGQLETAAIAEKEFPESLRAKYLLADATMLQGQYPESLALLNRFLKNFPENSWFLVQQAELLARFGRLQDALERTIILRTENPYRRDIVMLHARILWELGRWKESAALYASTLEPPVEKVLEGKIRELGLKVAWSPDSKGWWRAIVFVGEAEPSLAQVVMAPEHAADFSENAAAVNVIAAPRYAAYRWQERLSRELAVKRAVIRREYYHAAIMLENYIEQYGGNDFLLYDLAGLYSKLERLADEAALYSAIAARNPYFPGLVEAIQRNELKRRPRFTLGYAMTEEDGWDGYKSVRQMMLRGAAKYYRSGGHEWQIDLGRTGYESTVDDERIRGWRTMLTYNGRLSEVLGVSLGAGLESPGSEQDDTLLVSGKITGKVADEVRAAFSFNQDLVTDTTASIKRNIKKRTYRFEAMLDVFPSLLLGGIYDFADFSDSNWTSNYTLWASYLLAPEPTLFKISYRYDFYDSGEGPKPGVISEDGFALDDHPYWAPLNYWVTRFSFYFKHLLSNDALARGVPSYYILEYSLGYDSDENDLHQIRGSLNIEIAEKYLASASLGFLDLGVYQRKQALFSLTYRF